MQWSCTTRSALRTTSGDFLSDRYARCNVVVGFLGYGLDEAEGNQVRLSPFIAVEHK